MQRFAALLDRLSYAPGRNVRIELMAAWFQSAPDPDRGWALAALAGSLSLKNATAGMLRDLGAEVTDPDLFALSYDYVGDLAETVALLWPAERSTQTVDDSRASPGLAEVVAALQQARRQDVPGLLRGWLDGLDGTGRWALLKLVTGGLRVGVSAQMARMALAALVRRRVAAGLPVGTGLAAAPLDMIGEVWHATPPPYTALFAWIEGRGDRPDAAGHAVFRPFMLAQPLEQKGESAPRPPLGDLRAEWKWDGIRVQLVLGQGERKLFSRSGDDISASFPDLLAAVSGAGVLDGELLVMQDGMVGTFNALQQRLNRKTVSRKLQAELPVGIRAYDLLFDGTRDLRDLPLDRRRAALQDWLARYPSPRLDLSETVTADDWDRLDALRRDPPHPAIEGLMLKRGDSPYRAGRVAGLWYKWKRDPLRLDCVMMYARRGHGRRSSLYSDFTFGAWTDDPAAGGELVPVGKAYFGFTDAELAVLDRFVRENTVDRFGPVRVVAPELVLEVAFDGVGRSRRHKSGVAMRFPRISRIRTDKPAGEADRLATLEAMIPPEPAGQTEPPARPA